MTGGWSNSGTGAACEEREADGDLMAQAVGLGPAVAIVAEILTLAVQAAVRPQDPTASSARQRVALGSWGAQGYRQASGAQERPEDLPMAMPCQVIRLAAVVQRMIHETSAARSAELRACANGDERRVAQVERPRTENAARRKEIARAEE